MSTHPLTATLGRLAERERWLSVRSSPVTDEPGWHCSADLLADPDRLVALVADGAAALRAEHPSARPVVRRQVAAALVLGDWSWGLGVLGAGSLAHDRRVPFLDAAAAHLRFVDGRVSGVACSSHRFWCGVDDPHAEHPDARATDDLEAALRLELTGHLAPLHLVLRTTGLHRVGARAAWGAAGDGIATALRLQSDDATDPAGLLQVVDDVLAGAPRRWGRAGFERLVDGRGRAHLLRQRTSCCLYYRLPDTPACLSCPRTSAAERLARLDLVDD